MNAFNAETKEMDITKNKCHLQCGRNKGVSDQEESHLEESLRTYQGHTVLILHNSA